MKKSRFLVAAVAAMVMGLGTLNAQSTIYIGGVMPLSDYGDGTFSDFGLINGSSEKGGAGLGFTIGAKYRMPLTSGLSVMFTGDIMFNSLKDTITNVNDGSNSTNPNYINVPLMAGLNYEHSLGGSLSIYAEAGAGLNIRFITDYEGAVNVSGLASADATFSYDPAFTFAYQGGIGLKFNDKYSIGVNYYALGKADVKGTASGSVSVLGAAVSTGDHDFTAGKVNPSMLTIRLGYDF